MSENRFADWFNNNSGYTLHRPRIAQLKNCCKDNLIDTGKIVFIQSDEKNEENLPLLACTHCRKLYAKLSNGYINIDPLKYKIK